MVTVSEVVVRAVPEGISETTDGLEEVESATKETTDQMSEQSEEMSSFAQSFQGSMSAILAGLGVAAAGLLSQVPVIGEAFSGLTAVVDAVALRLDSVLRPVFGPITNGLIRLADIIATADGAFGLFLDSIILIGTVLGTIAGIIATVSTLASAFAGTFSTLATVGSVVVGVLTTIVSIIGIVPLAIGAAIVGLALLAWHFREEIVNAISAAIEGIQNFASKIGPAVSSALQVVRDKFTDLVADARGWGRSLIQRFIRGIKSLVGNLRGIIGDTEIAAGVSVNDITGAAGDIASSAGDAASGASDFIGSVGGSANKIFLDGQRVDNNQGRFRKDSLTRRGG